ncbi:MAG: hypothetical protein HZC17_05365 [Candidatus Omnitrophica bacterium]|nr:hypothetical protein [Candidatus Omnitrophota bacterium]
MKLFSGKENVLAPSKRLQRILEIHLDPQSGSRYWLEKEKVLGFSIQDQIQTEDDLWRLGPMNLNDLSVRPVEDFIPMRFLQQNRKLITAETGGATGRPKITAYFEEEFHKIFVESFIGVAMALDFSGVGRWLWIGPGGPHVIGKACNAIAKEMSGSDAFSIDFDPRWYRKLETGSVARARYLEHILSQALSVWNTQQIENVFVTPVVLEALIDRLTDSRRKKIRGIYLGGMPLKPETREKFKAAFPNAKVIMGYGNSLFGVCHSVKDLSKENGLNCYFPHHDRVIIRLISLDQTLPDSERLRRQVTVGKRGQVVFHRLDESYFLPNVMERDTAVHVEAGDEEKLFGSIWDGLADPCPLEQQQFKVEEGIY